MIIHTIPGVAADPRIFSKLQIDGHDLVHHSLPEVREGATIGDHAQVIAEKNDRTEPHVLIGMSMGGMIAQELASITHPVLVIIISSWKGPQEMPVPIKALRGTHPERMVTPKFIRRIKPFLYWQLGAGNDEDRSLIDTFIAHTSVDRIKHQLHASLNWDGLQVPPQKILHIHGDSDHLMPIEMIKDPIVVKGGGHIMVFNKAAEISAILSRELQLIDH